MRGRLSAALAAAFGFAVLFLFPLCVSAENSDYGYEQISDSAVSITSYSGSESELLLPGSIDGYTVVSIGEMAFALNKTVTSVVIPDTVSQIGASAFYSCSALQSVRFGGVCSIGSNAFYSCKALCKIELPVGITEIGASAFALCSGLESVVLPDGLTEIGEYAFMSCSALAAVVLPSTLQSIGVGAFSNCYSLSEITAPSALGAVAETAFANCTALKAVYYAGSAAEFAGVEVGSGNGSFTGAQITYGYSYSTHNYCLTVEKQPTCTLNGSAAYRCTYCGDSYTKTLAAAGHTPVADAAVAATCGADGKTAGSHCAVCSAVITAQKTVAPTGNHKWNSGTVTKAATCTKKGVKTYTCTVCGGSYTEEIPATGHSYTTVKTKATTDKKGVLACKNCGATKNYAKIKSVSLSASTYTYNGNAKKPTVTVKDSNGSTISSKYYDVTYVSRSTGKTVSSMKSVGKYYVKVKFKTRYSGTVKKAVTIKPKSTSISSITANSKGFTVKWGKVTTQTTGYQIQYSTSSDFSSKTTKTISGNTTTSKKITGLKAKKKYYVRVRTYKTVKVDGKSTKIYSGWSKVKTVTTKKS